MGYFILSPVLLADCKSEIGNWRRIANPPKQAGASILRRRSCGFEIRRQKRFDLFLCGFEIRGNKRGLQSSVGVPADLKSAETGTFSFLRRYLKRIANPK